MKHCTYKLLQNVCSSTIESPVTPDRESAENETMLLHALHHLIMIQTWKDTR